MKKLDDALKLNCLKELQNEIRERLKFISSCAKNKCAQIQAELLWLYEKEQELMHRRKAGESR